jgi:type I restriction enzyme S subunit
MSNDELPKNWDFCPLGEHVQLISGRHVASADWNERGEGVAYLTGPSDFVGKEAVVTKHTTAPKVMCQEGDILITVKGSGCGKVARAQQPACISRQLMAIRPRSNPGFWFQLIADKEAYFERLSAGSAIPGLSQSQILETEVPFPPLPEQRRIADVLDTVDAAIQETDAVVEKQKQVKTGLLQDLLTRGLDADGRLRDPEREPESFRETELGIFPQMWRIMTVEEVAESAIDGPFGSKLKTEHYVDQPGVRVVRLQNIGNGIFDDSDKAYVSREHARSLKRHEVLSGDLLVASLGDETHPVGRACQYPDGHSPAINKADCFRVRVREEVAHPRFVMHLLNCPDTRKDIGGLVQGVTRDRINLTNLKRVRLPIPPKDEQVRIVNRLRSESNHIAAEGTYRSKLQSLKTGLMQDLLTGRVRVPEAEDRVDEVVA